MSEFDALLQELKEFKVPKEEVRAAFAQAEQSYKKTYPGERFPFRLPAEFEPRKKRTKKSGGKRK